MPQLSLITGFPGKEIYDSRPQTVEAESQEDVQRIWRMGEMADRISPQRPENSWFDYISGTWVTSIWQCVPPKNGRLPTAARCLALRDREVRELVKEFRP